MDLSEVKNLIDAQGRAWEEFKKTNDELVKAKADGKAVSDLEAKLEKISKHLDQIEEVKAQVEEHEKKFGRAALGGGEDNKDLGLEVKSFNDMRRSNAQAGAQVADLDAAAYTAYKNAFWNMFRKGNMAALSSDEQKALQAGVDSDGGYLLPTPTVGRVVKKVYELSPIRQIASVMTISTDALEGINDLDEASYGWVGETGARTDTTTPTVGKYRIECAEMYAAPKATQKLLDDAAVDIEMWLAAKVADKFARVEAASFITGTGVGQPRGFTTYTMAATADASRSWGQLEKVKTGANGDFASSSPADVIFDLLQAFKPAYLQNAKFVTRRDVIAKIRKFKEATTNAYMWQPGLQQGQPDRLLGYPIVIAQDMPALGTGSASLGFGDWAEGYQVVDRIGIRTLRDPYTSKPYVIFYSTKRVGGGVLNFEAIKFLTFES
jgi:HK97 family phage major capsid protein